MSFQNRPIYAQLEFQPLAGGGNTAVDGDIDLGSRKEVYRQHIETIAHDVLKGRLPVIQTAALRGPFEKWPNPWASSTAYRAPKRLKFCQTKNRSLTLVPETTQAHIESGTSKYRRPTVTRSCSSAARPAQQYSEPPKPSSQARTSISMPSKIKRGKTDTNSKAISKIFKTVKPGLDRPKLFPAEEQLEAPRFSSITENSTHDIEKRSETELSSRLNSYIAASPVVQSRRCSWTDSAGARRPLDVCVSSSSPALIQRPRMTHNQIMKQIFPRGTAWANRDGNVAANYFSPPNSPNAAGDRSCQAVLQSLNTDTNVKSRAEVDMGTPKERDAIGMNHLVPRPVHKRPRLVTFDTPDRPAKNTIPRSTARRASPFKRSLERKELATYSTIENKTVDGVNNAKRRESLKEDGRNEQEVDEPTPSSVCLSTQAALNQALEELQEGTKHPQSTTQHEDGCNITPFRRFHSSISNLSGNVGVAEEFVSTQDLLDAAPDFTLSTIKTPSREVGYFDSNASPMPSIRASAVLTGIEKTNANLSAFGSLQERLTQPQDITEASEIGLSPTTNVDHKATSNDSSTPVASLSSHVGSNDGGLQAGQGHGQVDDVDLSFVLEDMHSYLDSWKPTAAPSASQVSVEG